MSQKNKFNIHDKGDLPLGSNSDNLQVEQVKETANSTKISKSRVRKALRPTEPVPEEHLEARTKIKSKMVNSVDDEKDKEHVTEKKSKKKPKTTLTSSSIEMEDLEALNEQNIRKHRSRSRRNIVIISILVSLLVVSVAVIAIYLAFIRLQNNCFLYVHGASASYIVDGEHIDKFRAPQSIRGNTVFAFDLDLDINDDREYNIRFSVEVYQDETLLDNIILYGFDQDNFTKGDDGFYYSDYKMTGTVDLIGGVVLDIAYEHTLNVNNFKMVINTYLY